MLGALAVAFVIYLIINILSSPYQDYSAQEYSEEPADWIEINQDVVTVNVTEATEGASYIDEAGGQQWHDGFIDTVFGFDALYSGHYFNEYYIEGNQVLMRIGPNLEPGNGVVEATMFEKIEDNKVTTYIFLDQDWKDLVGQTNIVWGQDYEYFREFVFSEMSKGIYMDKVEDSRARFSEDFYRHEGGVTVGNFTKKHIEDAITEGLTVVRIV